MSAHACSGKVDIEDLGGSRSAAGAAGRKTVVVVGNGMVGHRVVEHLAEIEGPTKPNVIVFGDEKHVAYDRVHLSEWFESKSHEKLIIPEGGADWYKEQGVDLRLNAHVTDIDPKGRVVSAGKDQVKYDYLVMATGAAPFVPPIAGSDRPGVFVYRTVDDLEAMARYAKENGCKVGAVLGGGLLGLEAANAVLGMQMQSVVVEFAPRLMARQLDDAGGQCLREKIEELGIKVLLGADTKQIEGGAPGGGVSGLLMKDGSRVPCDMVIISCGIKPRDALGKKAGLECHPRGGIVVNDQLCTSDPSGRIFAVGECLVWGATPQTQMVYGLVGPGYLMAKTLVSRLFGGKRDARFTGADMSTKLKLLGVDVCSFGDAFADQKPGYKKVVYHDPFAGVYKKVVTGPDGKLLGGILVGDAEQYQILVGAVAAGTVIDKENPPEELLMGARGGATTQDPTALPDEAQVCSCNDIRKIEICDAVAAKKVKTFAEAKKMTRVGTGCAGCVPLVTSIINGELAKMGIIVKNVICPCMPITRQDLYIIMRAKQLRSYPAVLATCGKKGSKGCEVCKPAVAALLACTWSELVLDGGRDQIQDTNDQFLANLQRKGTYSVVPRIPGGEIKPDMLRVLAEVAKKFGLYTKITGGQRIDLFGARVDQLPDIWEPLVKAGFESGHAYAKALRTIKSCVGSSWCRFGVQDSVTMAIDMEERYKGLRMPHKVKSAASGCVRECAEAQSKDFGVIATEKGWNVYFGGNGGAKPRHADLFAVDVPKPLAIRYIDRFLMLYIRCADKLERTARWMERLEGGLQYLQEVIIDDRLGLCAQLDADMDFLVSQYQCEWKAVVEDPVKRAKFRSFVNTTETDKMISFIDERGQRRPANWLDIPLTEGEVESRRKSRAVRTARQKGSWQVVGAAADWPQDGGLAVKHGPRQVAVFNFASVGKWYACQNVCPHKRDQVLHRGLLGTIGEQVKVACPVHKNQWDLDTGFCLTDSTLEDVQTFPIRVEEGKVMVQLPPLPGKLAHAL